VEELGSKRCSRKLVLLLGELEAPERSRSQSQVQ
jgi:hypothetical protein